jgi:glycosyltransferase involved in cell wall biosynthesis
VQSVVRNDNKPGVGKLRVLFVPWDRFPPFRPAARAIFLHELPKRGHEIDWLIQADESRPEANTVKIEGGIAYIGKTDPGQKVLNRVHKHLLNLVNSFRILNLVRANKYDLIQAKDNFGAAIVSLLVARLRGIHFFYWIAYPRAESYIYEGKSRHCRYPLFYRILGHFFTFLLYKIILHAADHIFVQSEQMKRDLAIEGISVAKMTPVPSSVNLDCVPYEIEERTHQAVEKGSSKWIVYLGTLKRARKLDFIIHAFAKILTAEPNAVLFIIGKGDQESDLQWLRSEAVRLEIDRAVRFTGFLEMAEGWEYIRHADVCLSPYFPTPILQSTSPTKLVEYMAMGKPVVANDHPEQTLVIEKSRAGLCTPWEEGAFADAVLKILRDPDEADRMGQRGRRYVQEHRTNQAMAELVEHTYAGVIGRRQLAEKGSSNLC